MRWTLWIAFAVLCILSGTSWAIPREMSDGLPPLEQQGILFGVIGLTALLFAGRRAWSRNIGLRHIRLAAAAVGIFWGSDGGCGVCAGQCAGDQPVCAVCFGSCGGGDDGCVWGIGGRGRNAARDCS